MSDADGSGQVVEVEESVDVVYFSLVFLGEEGAVVDCGYAHGVVAAVFEALEGFVY
jgi:hypothetical protein